VIFSEHFGEKLSDLFSLGKPTKKSEKLYFTHWQGILHPTKFI